MSDKRETIEWDRRETETGTGKKVVEISGEYRGSQILAYEDAGGNWCIEVRRREPIGGVFSCPTLSEEDSKVTACEYIEEFEMAEAIKASKPVEPEGCEVPKCELADEDHEGPHQNDGEPF